jgi:hypothetical protein
LLRRRSSAPKRNGRELGCIAARAKDGLDRL